MLCTEELDHLKGISKKGNVSLFGVLFSGLAIILHKWTNETNFTIGTVNSNRKHPDLDLMIGNFIDFLPIPVHINKEMTVGMCIDRFSNLVLNIIENYSLPMLKIVEKVNPDRNIRNQKNPLFNTALLLQNFTNNQSDFKLGEATSFTHIPVEDNIAELDIRFMAYEIDNELKIDCEYDAMIFESSTIQKLLASYKAVLVNAFDNPHQSISKIELDTYLTNMSYWKRKVQDWQPVALPYDFSYNTVNSTTSFIQYPINGSLLEDLEALAQQEDIRLSGLFLSVLKVLFYRYCGQEDICIICPNSNQEHNGLTLTNFLPLQSHLNDELSFKDFLKKVEILANEVAMHGEVSFDGIEQTMENENLPLHQVMFALIQDESAFSLDHEKEDFHISFIIEGLSDKPNIKIKYRSDLFLEETINRMARFYEYLLKSSLCNI